MEREGQVKASRRRSKLRRAVYAPTGQAAAADAAGGSSLTLLGRLRFLSNRVFPTFESAEREADFTAFKSEGILSSQLKASVFITIAFVAWLVVMRDDIFRARTSEWRNAVVFRAVLQGVFTALQWPLVYYFWHFGRSRRGRDSTSPRRPLPVKPDLIFFAAGLLCAFVVGWTHERALRLVEGAEWGETVAREGGLTAGWDCTGHCEVRLTSSDPQARAESCGRWRNYEIQQVLALCTYLAFLCIGTRLAPRLHFVQLHLVCIWFLLCRLLWGDLDSLRGSVATDTVLLYALQLVLLVGGRDNDAMLRRRFLQARRARGARGQLAPPPPSPPALLPTEATAHTACALLNWPCCGRRRR